MLYLYLTQWIDLKIRLCTAKDSELKDISK